MDIIIFVGIICFLTSFLAFLLSLIIALFSTKETLRQRGFFIGFTGGMLIAIISFELLPEAIVYSGTFLPVFTIIIALLVCAYLEYKLLDIKGKIQDRVLSDRHIAYLMFCINNVPEGFALGSVLVHNNVEARHIIYALFLHNLTDGILMFSNINFNKKEIIISIKTVLLTSFLMAMSAIVGGFLTYENHIVMPLSVGFVSGIMLYIAIGDAIPKSRSVWNGRLSTLGACIGVVVVILVNSVK